VARDRVLRGFLHDPAHTEARNGALRPGIRQLYEVRKLNDTCYRKGAIRPGIRQLYEVRDDDSNTVMYLSLCTTIHAC
jgi:hypothetical protein